MKSDRELYNEIISQQLEKESLYCEKAKVTAVDEAAGTCDVELLADRQQIKNVYFKTTKGNTDGIFITPTVNKYVWIDFSSNETAFVSLVQDYDKVTIKKGSISIVIDGSNVVINGGSKTVALAPDVVTQMNIVENKLNAFITKYNAHTHSGVTTGGSTSGTTAATETGIGTTVNGDIESPNFKG